MVPAGLEETTTRSENADTVVPAFTTGTMNPIVTRSTKIDQSQPARIEIITADTATGTEATCEFTF